jgi:hypothetical protein
MLVNTLSASVEASLVVPKSPTENKKSAETFPSRPIG